MLYMIFVFMTGFITGAACLFVFALHIRKKIQATQDAMTTDERVQIRRMLHEHGFDFVWVDGKLEPWKKPAEGP